MKVNKRLSKIILLIIIVFSITINTSAKEKNGYKVIINDEAKLLTTQQEDKLLDKMKLITKYGSVAFKTIDINKKETEDYAEEYFYDNFDDKESAVLFLIDMDNRVIYIYSDGYIHEIITSKMAEKITKKVAKYATQKKYYECASLTYGYISALLDDKDIFDMADNLNSIKILFGETAFIKMIG